MIFVGWMIYVFRVTKNWIFETGLQERLRISFFEYNSYFVDPSAPYGFTKSVGSLLFAVVHYEMT